MKIANRVCPVVAGFLTALVLGCVNPISSPFPADIPEDTPEDIPADVTSPSGIQDTTPFTVDVWVDDAARSATAIEADRIQENGLTGIRNIIQLVVVDEDGKVALFKEALKEREDPEGATLVATGLNYGSTYKFLLLMGHKERDYTAASGYAYQDKAPTLLAAGYTKTSVSGGETISITMYPVVVTDIKFDNGYSTAIAESGVNSLGENSRWVIKWDVTGLQALYDAAPDPGDIFGRAWTIVQGENSPETKGIMPFPPVTEQGTIQIPQDVSEYTAPDLVGKHYAVNFNVEYVPFHLQSNAWNGRTPPVWIIRNGVNDDPLDANTDFTSGVSWANGKNGNGAVNFTGHSTSVYVKDTGNDETGNGMPWAPFKTLAAAFDAIRGEYTKTTITVLSNLDLNDAVQPGAMTFTGGNRQITITSKGGPWKLTRSDATGTEVEDAVVTVTAGTVVAFSNITIDGIDNPRRVVNRALYIAGGRVTLEAGAHLVGQHISYTTNPPSGGGAVYVTSGLLGRWLNDGQLIMNDGSTITGVAGVLTYDPADRTGLYGGAVYVKGLFTMNGGKVSGYAFSGGGVYVAGGTFTMNNGEISDCTTNSYGPVDFTNPSRGAGVYVADGTFTMNNGTIINNTRSATRRTDGNGDGGGGGGVFVAGGKFSMAGGTMSNNKAQNSEGGGVFVAATGKFTMSGNSVISNNSATTSTNSVNLGAGGDGGGVFVAATGEFRMTGGTISVNKAEGNNNGDVGNGGGVYNSGTFNMTNSRNGAIPTSGTISGNEVDGNGGGVWNNGEFTMTDTLNDSSTVSGTIIGNKAAGGNGGGVYSENAGIFTMENGIMYGLDSREITDNELKNNAPKGSTFIYVDQGSADYTINSYP